MDVKQTVTDAVNKVEEAVGIKTKEAPVEEAKPEVEVPVAQESAPQQSSAPVVDRSAYNCPACGGEGLQDENTRCPNCGGTGKV